MDTDRLSRLSELVGRFKELDDDQLDEVSELLHVELAVAADSKDIDRARSVSELNDRTTKEVARRRRVKAENERELKGLLQRAGLIEQEEEQQQEPEAATSLVASLMSTPKIADLVRARRATGSPLRRSTMDEPVFRASSGRHELHGLVEVGREFIERLRGNVGPNAVSGRFTIATADWSDKYPDHRRLGDDSLVNREKIESVVGRPALLASGGICGPLDARFDVDTIASASRPLRDSLPRFDASRGGVRFTRAPLLNSVSSGIGVVTPEEDETGSAYPKGCVVISCPDEEEVKVDAIFRCATFGNNMLRFQPEQVAAVLDLLLALHSRTAESHLFQTIGDQSTAVTSTGELGAFRDLVATLGLAAAGMRSRHRTLSDAIIRIVLPAWVRDLLRTDLSRQAAGDQTQAVSNEQLDRWLGEYGIRVVWVLEAATNDNQVFGSQGVAPLLGWPTTATALMYPEGSWLFLDGSTLDLGIVRDSQLNQTNDAQAFAESFEQAFFGGPESLSLELELCPSGISAGATDVPIACAS